MGIRDRIRVPLLGTLRPDPFVKLNQHAKMVKKCTESMQEAIVAFFKADFETFEQKRGEVRELEGSADDLKKSIRNHLPGNIHMPVEKSNFLLLLTQQDKILDYEEDVVQWLAMRQKPYDKQLYDEFIKLTDKVVESTSYFEQAIFNIPDVLEASFSDDERNETKQYIKKVSNAEYESDLLEHELTKLIFSLEGTLSPVDIYHLLRVVQLLGEVANHAENASDCIRTLLAR